MNNHQDGVAPSQFVTNPQLASFYNLLSTNVDRDGNPFGSTMEGLWGRGGSAVRCGAGKVYPIFGSQWHPEKNAFEWTPEEARPPARMPGPIARRTSRTPATPLRCAGTRPSSSWTSRV